MFATLAILSCFYSFSLATTSSPAISAPASFYLARAFVDNRPRSERLFNELFCLTPAGANSAGLPKALQVLRTKCKDNVKYKILMRLLATRQMDNARRELPLLAYISSYQSTLNRMIDTLLDHRLDWLRKTDDIQEGGAAAKQRIMNELKQTEVYKKLEAEHKEESIDVVNGIFCDQYKDFADNIINIGNLKSIEGLTVDNYGEDVALKAAFDDLGPILNLPQWLNIKKGADFFRTIQNGSPWLQGKDQYERDIAAAYSHLYLYLNNEDYNEVVNVCESIRKDAIQKLQKEKNIVNKLKLIAEKEREIMEFLLHRFDQLNELKRVSTTLMQFKTLQFNSDQVLESRNLDRRNPYDWKPSNFGITDRIKLRRLYLSMFNIVDAEPIIASFANPSERKTKFSPFAGEECEYSKKFHELVKDLDLKFDANTPKLENTDGFPPLLIPQAIMLTEHESWRLALKQHLLNKELTHDERKKLHHIYEELSDWKLKVDQPALAIYEHGGKILLKPSPAYKAVIAILKRPSIKDHELTQLMSDGTGKLSVVYNGLFTALAAIRNFADKNEKIEDTIKTLSQMLEAAERGLKDNSQPCEAGSTSKCIPFDKAADILYKLDENVNNFITKNVRSSHLFTQEMARVKNENIASIRYQDATSKHSEMLGRETEDELEDVEESDERFPAERKDLKAGAKSIDDNYSEASEDGEASSDDESVMVDTRSSSVSTFSKILTTTLGLGLLLAVLVTLYMVLTVEDPTREVL